MRILFENHLTLPVVLVWLPVLAFLLWRWRRASRVLLAVGAVLFVTASVPAVGKLLMWSLGGSVPTLHITDGKPYSAIVVPTAGIYADAAGRWWPTANSIRRATAGLQLQSRLGLPLIIVGGVSVTNQPPEAEVVAESLGLDGGDVVIEPTGGDSAESGAAVGRLLVNRVSGPVILVTSAVHLARMSASLRHYRVDVVVASGSFLARDYSPSTWSMGDFVPSNKGFKLTRGALWEYTGILWYLAGGKIDIGDLLPGESGQVAASSS
jgi:uncharacterized SAM-binding protein YcdF (DUF218 family)